MAIANRNDLVETLSLIGLMGAARQGDLDGLFTPVPMAAATTAALGSVKKAVAVPDLAAQTVTDIATAQTAVTAIVTKLNALLAASRTAGQLT
ncbi:hypothetical protein D3C75_588190 [compost metagenome]